MVSAILLMQDLFGGGLLSAYAPPASNASMYGHQRAHAQPGVYQQPQPQPQPSFQYGEPPGGGQLASGYLQAQPAGPPALVHGTSVGGYGGHSSAGLAFDGPVRQRSHSDNSGTGQLITASCTFKCCTSVAAQSWSRCHAYASLPSLLLVDSTFQHNCCAPAAGFGAM